MLPVRNCAQHPTLRFALWYVHSNTSTRLSPALCRLLMPKDGCERRSPSRGERPAGLAAQVGFAQRPQVSTDREMLMSNEAESGTSPEEPARWLQATAEDFSAVDLNKPVATSSSVDTRELSGTLNQFVKTLEGLQRAPEERVYLMLGAVCSFHFKPSDREEPFGPMMQFDNRRTAIPSDFKGAPASTLASNMERIENPAVRARVADVVWLLDRKQATAAWTAVDSYIEIVKSVRDGSKSFFSDNGVHGFEIAAHLRRCIQIARAVGWRSQRPRRSAISCQSCALRQRTL